MRARLRRSVWLVVLEAALLCASSHAAEPASGTSRSGDAATEEARGHFKTGVKLYQDQNYAGALSEFEAAYQRKPGPGSLQNVALCQKALFRYGEAVDTLTRLLTRHAAELSDAEKSSAERARDELAALVGSVKLVVSPPNADVILDGQPVPLVDRDGPLRLNVGEHTLGASAPGHARVTTTIRVASGQREVPVELTLVPTAGFLDIGSSDPGAAISIDGQPVAFGHFLAAVTPDQEHLVQIYRQGSAPFEARVTVGLGKTVAVRGQPGAPSAGAPARSPTSMAAPAPPPKPAVGWYGDGALSLLATGATPFRFDLTEAKQSAWGVGVHVGRRIRPAVAVEGLLEYDVLKVRGACDEVAGEFADKQVLCSDPAPITVGYLVRDLRFGPNLELMTTDPRFRGLGGLGLGLVWHELRVGPDHGHSVNPYFLLELGIGANTKHVLFALSAQLLLDGTRGMGRRSPVCRAGACSAGEAAFERTNGTLPFVGLSLRVGYSEWSP
jgi:hypothetical protein